jgi:RHS repeat-associated protein
MWKSGVLYRFVLDERGSVRLVVNTGTGAVAQRLDYDTWGNVTSDTSPGFQPFGYAGGLWDSTTGLARFGARDYDSQTGRLTNKDPLRFGGGDTNLYVYVADDPINRTDPSGLLFGGFVNAGECAGQSAAQYWASQSIDPDNAWWETALYTTGGLFASLWTPATSDDTFAVLSAAAGSASLFRQPGQEWSHFLPARWGAGRGGPVPDLIIDSPLNGNFTSAIEHGQNDPFRARFFGKEFMDEEVNPALLRMWNRLPDWVKGLGLAGALEGSGGSGTNCECGN